jgi:hypothetical protein
MRARPIRLIAATLAIVAAAAAAGAEGPELFAATEPIDVTLTGPFAALSRDRRASPEAHPGVLGWRDATGAEHRVEILLRPRGKSRRDRRICAFPPLRLDFATEAVVDTPFARLDKVKLVTHCTQLGKVDRNAVQRQRLELLVYRLFNRMTDASFRVRPLEIDYVDTDRKERTTHHSGFLIEPEADLARRLGLAPVAEPRIERTRLDSATASLVEVFEYLIGNTDFSLTHPHAEEPCCHNVVPLARHGGAGGVVPVPYDFDATGLVDPPYAHPLPAFHLTSVRERLFRGHCRDDRYLAGALEAYRRARTDLYALVENDAVLSERSKRKTRTYLDAFFATIDAPESVARSLVDRCI